MGKTGPRNQILTDVELEVMRVLWRHGPSSVRQVLTELSKERPLAYTSVSTMLRILVDKGAVRMDGQGRVHQYEALLQEHEYQQKALASVVDRVFEGSTLGMLRCLLDSNEVPENELQKLRAFLEEN